MNCAELSSEIVASLGFQPTDDQQKAIGEFCRFMFHPSSSSAMLMRGSAGTGKTSVASAIVRTLHRLGQRVVLLAPTGRAAKVFALNSGHAAFTIHRRIFRQLAFSGVDTGFNLNNNTSKNTLFIVDESSMISDLTNGDDLFGGGSLLVNLIKYVYSGENCHLMLIGDSAQLPPVGSDESPALDASVLRGFGLEVFSCQLDEVLRQSRESGILYNATMIRQLITHDEITQLPSIRFRGFADISIVDGNEIIESLTDSYSKVGIDDTMVITRSNKRCLIYNQGIRARILDREDELSSSDRIMIVKNNYHWTEQEVLSLRKANLPTDEVPAFFANGDIAVVRRVRNVRNLYGFRFCDAILCFPDYDNYEIQLTLLLDSLSSESPSLTHEEQEQLFRGVYEDYFDRPLKSDRMKAVREDSHYNALQVKHAYAVTCHKAQGGQWSHIYLDQGYMTDEMLSPDYIHWLYTAFTRATQHLYLVNWPKSQIER